MFNLPQELIREIYEYDPTYREQYRQVLHQVKRYAFWRYSILTNLYNLRHQLLFYPTIKEIQKTTLYIVLSKTNLKVNEDMTKEQLLILLFKQGRDDVYNNIRQTTKKTNDDAWDTLVNLKNLNYLDDLYNEWIDSERAYHIKTHTDEYGHNRTSLIPIYNFIAHSNYDSDYISDEEYDNYSSDDDYSSEEDS